jgi:tetratricopeptide (TPR) repeat protein
MLQRKPRQAGMGAETFSNMSSREKAFISLVVDALRQQNLTIIVGAGISKSAGLPSWHDLALVFLDELRVKYDEQLPSEPIKLAELYKDAFGVHRLRQVVCDALRSTTEPSRCHKALADLGYSVHFFTTNYDTLLETALRQLSGGPAFQVITEDQEVDYIRHDLIPVYKLAGSADRPSSLIIAHSDYLIYRKTNPRIISRFVDELRSRTAVFVGSSLLDPTIEHCLGEAFGQTLGKGRRAFVVLDKATQTEQVVLESVGLQPVILGDYERLPGLLHDAKEALLGTPNRITTAIERMESSSAKIKQAYEVAGDALEAQLQAIRERFDLGASSTVCNDIDALLQQISALPPNARSTLESNACLLGARAAIQLWGRNNDKVDSYLSHAEAAGLTGLEDEYRIVRAMSLHAKGETNQALELLQGIDSDWAIRTKFAINLTEGKITACEDILNKQKADSGAFNTASGHRFIAIFYLRKNCFTEALAEAQAAIQTCRESSLRKPSAQVLETSAIIYEAAATERLRSLIDRHHLVPELTVEIDVRPLIDESLANQAEEYYMEAACAFDSLHNQQDAMCCYLQAYLLSSRDIEHANRQEAVLKCLRNTEISVLVRKLVKQQADAKAFEELNKSGLDIRQQNYLLSLILDESDADGIKEKLAESTLLRSAEISLRLSALVTLLTLYMKRNDTERVADLAATTVLPHDYAYIQQLFSCMAAQQRNDTESARIALQTALAMAPRNPSVLLGVLRHFSTLLRDNDENGWKNKCWQHSQVLLEELPTSEAYEQFANWGLEAGRHQEVLAILDSPEASAACVHWKLQVWRGRALGLLGRSSEACEALLDALQEDKDFPSYFFVELVRLLLETGDYHRAVTIASQAYKQFPEDPNILMAAVAASEESGDLEVAYSLAKEGASKHQDTEYIQAKWIQLGFATANSGETAAAMAKFVERWPESELIRKFQLEECAQLIKDMHRRAEYLFTLYSQGSAPVTLLCHEAPTSSSYFKFWNDRWESKAPLFATRGFDAGLAEQWISQKHSPSFIIDYTAVLTLWRLFGKHWANRLYGLDWALVDLNSLLNTEIRQLQTQHLDHYDRQVERVADWIKNGLTTERLREIPGGYKADEMGFSTERGLIRLTISPPAEIPSSSCIGIGDLSSLFQLAGVASARQAALLSKYGQKIASDSALAKAQRERSLVLDDMVLEIVIELGELQWLSDFTKEIWIAKQSIDRAEARRLQISHTRDLIEDYKAFRQNITEIQQREASRILPCVRQSNNTKQEPTLIYAQALIRASQDTQRSLLTDDHFFHRSIEGGGERPFGTSTLLRFLFLRGEINELEYCQYLDQLVAHGYRWIPMEEEYLCHLMNSDPYNAVSQIALGATRDYLRGLMSIATRKDAPPPIIYSARAMSLRFIRQVLPNAILRAYSDEIPEETVTSFLKQWAPDRLLLGSGLQPTAFLMAFLDKFFDLQQGDARRNAVAWIDQVLQSADYDVGDIDMTWAFIVEHLIKLELDHTDRNIPQEMARDAIRLLTANFLNDLPERTRMAIYSAKIGEQLREQLGHPDTLIQIAHKDEVGEHIILRITERELQKNMDALLAGVPEGRFEININEKVFLRFETASISRWFVTIQGYLREADQNHCVQQLKRQTDWYRQVASETSVVRSYAWKEIYDIAKSKGISPKDIPDLRLKLESIGDESKHAGLLAQRFVRRKLPLFSNLLEQYILQKDTEGSMQLLATLSLDEASEWLSIAHGSESCHQHLLDRRLGAIKEAFGKIPFVLDAENLEYLINVSTQFAGSLFIDGALFLENASDTIANAQNTEISHAEFLARWLSLLRDRIPVQRVWLNCALATMRVAARHNLWREKVNNFGAKNETCSLASILHDTLKDSLESHRPNIDRQISMFSEMERRIEAFLYLNWAAQGDDLDCCRYTASITSSLLVAALSNLQKESLTVLSDRVKTFLPILVDRTRRMLFQHIALHPPDKAGRYKNEWACFIPYELEYFGKHVTSGDLRAIMSDDLRRSLLGIGKTHLFFSALLGESDARETLDSELHRASDGNISDLLMHSGEPSRWLTDEQKQLEFLSQGISNDWFISLWMDDNKCNDNQLVFFLDALMCGATTATDVWMKTIMILLDPIVQAKAIENKLLFSLIACAASLGVMANPGSNEAKSLLRWLTPRPTSLTALTAEVLSAAMASLIWANGKSKKPSPLLERRCFEWLKKSLVSPRVENQIKHQLLKAFGEVWDSLPESFRLQLRRVMELMRSEPRVRTWLEWRYYGFLPESEEANETS